jgi:hypothetical protein
MAIEVAFLQALTYRAVWHSGVGYRQKDRDFDERVHYWRGWSELFLGIGVRRTTSSIAVRRSRYDARWFAIGLDEPEGIRPIDSMAL